MNARAKMVASEAASKHWLQANWRPACSIALLVVVCLDSFGVIQAKEQLYTIATAFLGLYGAGRSVEKAASAVRLGK